MIALNQTADGVLEPQRVLPLEGEYDVLVVGGGVAGVGAAIAAARAGCKVLLVEWASALGGLATVGLVPIPHDLASGIGREMFDALEAVDGLRFRNSDPEKHKLVLDRMVTAAGVDLLLTAHVVDAIMEGDEIRGVVIESKSGRQAILARRVVDCSGDADAAAFAGAEFSVGRETDGYTQGCSLDMRLGGVDWDAYQASDLKRNDPQWIRLVADALRDGDLPYEIDNHLNWMTHVPGRPEHCGMDEVCVCFAHSRRCRPLETRDLTRMYLEGREQADILWRFLRKRVPGFERCFLVDTGYLLGVRDSRRILGEYTLTAEDLASMRKHDDVIATSQHGYDIHNPDGPGNIKWAEMTVDGEKRYVICRSSGLRSSAYPPGGVEALTSYWGTKEYRDADHYDIPYRCLVPARIENLLVAGRCLSATFTAQSGARLIMVCMTMGEAAGTAAALSLQQGIPPRKLDRVTLQRTLIANGVKLGQDKRQIPGLG